ncbi:hypothetical protein ACFSYH_12605 [Populibacterium corticicola]|uniref:Uncharacterized protein n=1 Tax=Populibacterium corticicola TaxID=1812826 RepID=A0ABW5XHQ3_9MICO
MDFPYSISFEPTAAQYLYFLAEYCKDAQLVPHELCALALVRTSYVNVDEFGDARPEISFQLAFRKSRLDIGGGRGFNAMAPTSAVFDESVSIPQKLEVKSVESYSAQVFIVRNKPGKKQDSLPKLFRAAAKFVDDNGLDFDTVESVRYVYGFDSKMRVLPELHITVLIREDVS